MLIRVKVKPRSKVSELAQLADGAWLARLKSPPVDGKANAELIGLVASHFRRPRSAVSVKAGKSARLKTIVIDGA